MAFKLNGNPLAVDVPFTVGDINYPANWLRLSTAQEKKDLGITEVADDPVYDGRFYNGDGSAKSLTDTTETIDGVEFQLRENQNSMWNIYSSFLFASGTRYIIKRVKCAASEMPGDSVW